MWQISHFYTLHHLGKGRFCVAGIIGQKLVGHESTAYDEIHAYRLDYLNYGRHSINERNIHSFYLRPAWKSAVGDHQGIRMAHTAQQ